MFKKITKKIVAVSLLSTFLVASSAIAATLGTSTTIDVLKVAVEHNGSKTGWQKSINIYKGDKIGFQIHSYANGDVTGLDHKLENINNKSFSKNSSEAVSGYVDASNASRMNDSTTLYFKDNITLKYTGYSLREKKVGTNPEANEHSLSLPNGQNGSSSMDSNGSQIGSLTNEHRMNLLIYFTAVEDTPTYSNCTVNGTTVNHGSSRTFFSTTHVAYGETCSSVDLSRKCTDGNISGSSSYKYTSCSVDDQDENVVITTKHETYVSDVCATFNGNIDLNGDNSEYVRFRYGTSSSMNNTTNVGTKTSNGNFSKKVCGLNPNTRYYFQAYSTSATGERENFRTEDEDSSETGDVDTNSATSVNEDSARLNGDINRTDMDDVWFAFSRTDSTPSCSTSSQRVESYGREDEGDNFYANVSSLRDNTTYYFRACGEDVNGNDVQGSVKDFRTDREDVSDTPAQVTTQNATKIGKTSAQLNGYVDINDTENGKVYFVYGTSRTNMNIETGKSSVIRDNTAFQSIVGLSPNTRYYYQALVRDNGGIVDRGVIKTFVTDANGVVVTPVNGRCGAVVNSCTRGYYTNIYDSSTQYKWRCNGTNTGTSVSCTLKKPTRTIVTPTTRPVVVTPTAKPIEVVVVNETTTTVVKNYEEKGLRINKTVSTEKFGTYGISTAAKIGDKVYYKIRVKNNSDETIEDVEVKDFIPAELDMNGNSTNNVDKFATYIINLQPGQSKTVLTEMILSDNASNGDVIDSAAKITMDGVTENTNAVTISVIESRDNLASNNNDNRNGQAASIFGANSDFFPSSIIGWLLLLILALGAGLLVTKILTVNTRD